MLEMILSVAATAAPALGLRVEVQPLGKGTQATVVGVAIQVAPEDLKRAGERLRVSLSFLQDGKTVDSGDAVVDLQADGSALLYREWPAWTGARGAAGPARWSCRSWRSPSSPPRGRRRTR